MASTHKNLAVTREGETYNKLSRPSDYLISTTPLLPPLSPAARPSAPANKRKRGREGTTGSNGSKRIKDEKAFGNLNHDAAVLDESWSAKSYGMRTILPGGEDEVELTGESTNEAMAYLRSVRSEASKIPPLLVAQTTNKVNNTDDIALSRNQTGTEDGVFYRDGVWVAVDGGLQESGVAVDPDGRRSSLEPQQGYYDLILARFQALRIKLLDAGFPSTKFAASRSHRQPRNRGAWLDVIDVNLPTSDYICHLDQSSLFHALEACSASLGRSASISREKSCWIWTLLAMTSDAGTMNSQMVGKIRYLGMQAARLSARLQQEDFDQDTHESNVGILDEGKAAKDNQEHSMQATDNGVVWKDEAIGTEAPQSPPQMPKKEDGHENQGVASSCKGIEAPLSDPEGEHTQTLELARARLLAQLGDRLVPPRGCPLEEEGDARKGFEKPSVDDAIDWNTKATIDMILTVVAELYGQRDLLKFRLAW